MTPQWVYEAIFYHIYPLGLCAAPHHNDLKSAPVARLKVLENWVDHIQSMGVNALYIGPLFESTTHGYDTVDYFQVDRRLGDDSTLLEVVQAFKQRGIRIVLDAVFNHVGRDFPAFQDVLQHGQQSAYRDWFYQLDFSRSSPYGDPFYYEGWAGHYSLVKLNLANPSVRQHLFDAVRQWIERYDIDGLRLDAADSLDPAFMRELSAYCRSLKPDFWLMGEVVHGDYRHWANPDMLHATTNYECYTGLYSSHVDHNYFEIAYALDRQFGPSGLYRDLLLYSFADNHDVNRVASNLTKPAHLYPLYGLLFTMPGVPSIYYGSEWGLTGKREPHSDQALRPAIDLSHMQHHAPHPDLVRSLQRFAAVRRQLPALQRGNYQQHFVSQEQFVFSRATAEQTVLVAVNAADRPATVRLTDLKGRQLQDVLNPSHCFPIEKHSATVQIPSNWLRVMVLEV